MKWSLHPKQRMYAQSEEGSLIDSLIFFFFWFYNYWLLCWSDNAICVIQPSIGKNLTDSTQRASNYLNQELSRMTDDYELSITAYTLALMNSPSSRNALSKLGSSSRIVSSTDMNGKMHVLTFYISNEFTIIVFLKFSFIDINVLIGYLHSNNTYIFRLLFP